MLCCKSTTKNNNSNDLDFDEIAQEYVGDNYNLENFGSLWLITSVPKIVGDVRVKYVVIERLSGEVIYGPAVIKGEVSWYAENELLLQK